MPSTSNAPRRMKTKFSRPLIIHSNPPRDKFHTCLRETLVNNYYFDAVPLPLYAITDNKLKLTDNKTLGNWEACLSDSLNGGMFMTVQR